MKAIILAAGEGVRMRPLTLKTPKALLKVNGKTLLEHTISCLPKEIDELILVIGYLHKQIKDYCGAKFLGKKVRYIWQKKPRGTYHALKLCQRLIKIGERFLVLPADDLHGKKGIENCLKHRLALLVAESENPQKFGVVRLSRDSVITEIIEKPENPPSNLISTAVMVLDSKIFKYKPKRHPNGEHYLSEAVSQMIKDGRRIYAVKATLWLPIGYPEDLKKNEKILR